MPVRASDTRRYGTDGVSQRGVLILPARAGGTSFRIERSTTPVGGAAGTWNLIDVVEQRSYVDASVPRGLAVAQYRVIAQRSGGVSVASEPGQVIFGTTSSAIQSSGADGGLSLAA